VLASFTGFTADLTKHARQTNDIVVVHATNLDL